MRYIIWSVCSAFAKNTKWRISTPIINKINFFRQSLSHLTIRVCFMYKNSPSTWSCLGPFKVLLRFPPDAWLVKLDSSYFFWCVLQFLIHLWYLRFLFTSKYQNKSYRSPDTYVVINHLAEYRWIEMNHPDVFLFYFILLIHKPWKIYIILSFRKDESWRCKKCAKNIFLLIIWAQKSFKNLCWRQNH